jgi:hypothetical protein
MVVPRPSGVMTKLRVRRQRTTVASWSPDREQTGSPGRLNEFLQPGRQSHLPGQGGSWP